MIYKQGMYYICLLVYDVDEDDDDDDDVREGRNNRKRLDEKMMCRTDS